MIQRLRRGVACLCKQLPVVRAVLFGSYATWRHVAGSDVDLLIVYEGEKLTEDYALVKRTIQVPRLEPHLYTAAEYERLRSMIERMTAGGVTVL